MTCNDGFTSVHLVERTTNGEIRDDTEWPLIWDENSDTNRRVNNIFVANSSDHVHVLY